MAPAGAPSHLDRPLSVLKGIGSAREKAFADKGFHTVGDLLYFLPVRYEDRTRISPMAGVREGAAAVVAGRVVRAGEERLGRSGRKLFRITVTDDTGTMDLLWFNYRAIHLTRTAVTGAHLLAYGRLGVRAGTRHMIHPELHAPESEDHGEYMGIYPVYSAVQGISGAFLRKAMAGALERYRGLIPEPIPIDIRDRLGLPELESALEAIHFPRKDADFDRYARLSTEYHRRIAFERIFAVMLSLGFRNTHRAHRSAVECPPPDDFFERLEGCFGFRLTGAQHRVIDDIVGDMTSLRPMNRLLQGDVGCGKTIVAAAAACLAVFNGHQAAVMAPTQILARQHYEYFRTFPESMGVRPVLLTGALTAAERRDACRRIASGDRNVIVGTQALIQDDVTCADCALVVIDEQHRFGVRQRRLLDGKGHNPHLLVMTATPIPRTLAMTVYADLDVSIIDEYPGEHRPVETHLVAPRLKRKVFESLVRRLTAGQQAMVVCPVIEDTGQTETKDAESMYAGLTRLLSPEFRVGLIHGRMSPRDKTDVMERFKNGTIDVLVGTTVVEVGIHVPGAAMIIIEHPERFGLAQLHQLRGRVGRGSDKGVCILMGDEELSHQAVARLEALVTCHDGFVIAEKDLELRGQGELTGMRQAGRGEIDFAEMLRDPPLLAEAKREADRLLAEDPMLTRPEHGQLRAFVRSFPGPGWGSSR